MACFTVRTELADSIGHYVGYIQQLKETLGEQQWDLLVSEHILGFQIKIGRPKFYSTELGTKVIGAWPSFLKYWSPP